MFRVVSGEIKFLKAWGAGMNPSQPWLERPENAWKSMDFHIQSMLNHAFSMEIHGFSCIFPTSQQCLGSVHPTPQVLCEPSSTGRGKRAAQQLRAAAQTRNRGIYEAHDRKVTQEITDTVAAMDSVESYILSKQVQKSC